MAQATYEVQRVDRNGGRFVVRMSSSSASVPKDEHPGTELQQRTPAPSSSSASVPEDVHLCTELQQRSPAPSSSSASPPDDEHPAPGLSGLGSR